MPNVEQRRLLATDYSQVAAAKVFTIQEHVLEAPALGGNGVGVLFDGQRSRGGDRFRLRREDWLSYN